MYNGDLVQMMDAKVTKIKEFEKAGGIKVCDKCYKKPTDKQLHFTYKMYIKNQLSIIEPFDDAAQCYIICGCYFHIKQDKNRSFEYFKLAYKAGHPGGCRNLGTVYHLLKNNKLAKYYWLKGCDLNNSHTVACMLYMGWYYQTIKKNKEKSIEYYKMITMYKHKPSSCDCKLKDIYAATNRVIRHYRYKIDNEMYKQYILDAINNLWKTNNMDTKIQVTIIREFNRIFNDGEKYDYLKSEYLQEFYGYDNYVKLQKQLMLEGKIVMRFTHKKVNYADVCIMSGVHEST